MTIGTGYGRTAYGDPTVALIWKLPIIAVSTKVKLRDKWFDARPDVYCDGLSWFDDHDANIIFALRAVVALAPTLLIPAGVPLHLVVPGVAVGLMITETLARKRERNERNQLKEEFEREKNRQDWEQQSTNPLV